LWNRKNFPSEVKLNAREAQKLYSQLVRNAGEFQPDALNRYNEWFYHRKYVASDGVLHNTFTENSDVVTALGNCMLEGFHGASGRVKVIMAGSSIESAFQQIATQHRNNNFEVMISDFFEIPVKRDNGVVNLLVRSVRESILDEMDELSEEKRHDVMLCTYGFDSVWMRGDYHYILTGGQWYRSLHRLNVVSDGLGDSGSPYMVETIVFPVVDMTQVEYGEIIIEIFGDCSEVRVNVPSGLIRTVREVFEKQLHRGGMFIVGDICSAGELVKEYEFLESGAMYKIEDYRIAEKVLNYIGFNAHLFCITEFLKTYSGDALQEKLFGKYVLVVTK